MDIWLIVIIVVAAAVLAAGATWWWMRGRRRRRLQNRFGPEYDRQVRRADSQQDAEERLAAREQRREQFDIQPLPEGAARRYEQQWNQIQRDFVDEPAPAIGRADELIQQVMRQRGYPVDNFERRAADLSVDHPEVVQHYREGHRLATSDRQTTEQLRDAMLHYRTLFDALVTDTGHDDQDPS